jgi:magnesium chelatase subunit D
VLGLLLDAYQRRDRVALVTFRGDGAEVALRPTGSVEVARARLGALPTGGRTPLAAGITTALGLAAHPTDRPLLVLVSDGRATAGPDGVDPLVAAKDAAAEVRRRGVPAVVVDAEDGNVRLGLAAELAQAMGARYLTLPQLSAGAVRSLLPPG